jgi:multidrug efflux pump subunit AcrA (membrane-fusion protein)
MQTPVKLPLRPGCVALILAAVLGLGLSPARAAAPQAVRWSAAQISAADLHIQHLEPAAYRQTFSASATVQSPVALLQNLSALDVARARRRAAQASLQLAQVQAQRMQGLFQAGQNVAMAAVQQAQAAAQQAQAQVEVAQAAQQAAQTTLSASLGPALAQRLQHDAALRGAIASGRALIVDLALPPGAALPPAAQVRLHLPGGDATRHDGWLPASVVGPAAAASAQVQGLRYALVAPAASGLMPGLHLQAQVQSGQAQSGVLLPVSAVVWSSGRAVVFVATPAAATDNAAQPFTFTPRAVSTTWPLQGGYVQPGWAALDVVTHGAGLVLTPPPKPHAQPASGGDDD